MGMPISPDHCVMRERGPVGVLGTAWALASQSRASSSATNVDIGPDYGRGTWSQCYLRACFAAQRGMQHRNEANAQSMLCLQRYEGCQLSFSISRTHLVLSYLDSSMGASGILPLALPRGPRPGLTAGLLVRHRHGWEGAAEVGQAA